MLTQIFLQVIFVAAEITEIIRVLQRELQRFERMIEAHKAEIAREVPRGAQNGKGIGGRTQTDIPDHKFAGVRLKPLAEPELIDVKRLRLGDRPDDRMKRLGIRQRTHGTDAVVQADELVAGVSLHGSVLRILRSTKRKTGNPSPRIAGPTQTNTKIRVASSPCPARRKAGSSWLPFRRPCWRDGTWCP